MKKTTNNRLGFTLVELLVVISIISMLAALIFPAIQGAREQGRRTQCINNQRQVAYALLSYESTKGSFPALRAPLKPALYPCEHFHGETVPAAEQDYTELTWVSFILPHIEQNTAWNQINLSGIPDATLYELVLPIMQCRSSRSPGDDRISYVANAGPQNFDYASTSEAECVEYGNEYRDQRDDRMYTLFFDHFAAVGPWRDRVANPPVRSLLCKTKVSMDYISSLDGTSYTILISENEDADRWIWEGARLNSLNIGFPVASNHLTAMREPATIPEGLMNMEGLVGFCYPNEFDDTGITGGIDYWRPVYVPPVMNGIDNIISPLFINEGRSNSGIVFSDDPAQVRARKSRPSSGHPGVVIVAFCDQHTQVLRDDIDKLLFVRLCRPSSGVIINPRDLD